MNLRNIFFILLLSSFIACGNSINKNKPGKAGFAITGVIKNAKGSINIQEITNTGLLPLDTSAILEDGTFELDGTVKEKTFCVIRLPKGDIIVVIDSNSRFEITIDADNLDKYAVKGSKENDDLKILMDINTKSTNQMAKLEEKYTAVYGNNIPPVSVQAGIRAEFDSITRNNEVQLKAAIDKMNSIVPYFAANFMMPEAEFAFLNEIDKKLYSKFQNSKYAAVLHSRVQGMAATATGSLAPEIKLNDPYGKEFALSSLRGKVVMIDFWASWCAPCRKENPKVVALYQKYHDKGFDILGVSLDNNREKWINAINADKLTWYHVSDLLQWNTPLLRTYNFESIPHTVLIDKEGKIIATKLRGEALEAKLKELFGY
ncbi:MAG: thioredoxin-like domain-containing protein [Candidatus Methylacidiphilales bacterium]